MSFLNTLSVKRIREITSAADLKDYLLGWDYQGTTEE